MGKLSESVKALAEQYAKAKGLALSTVEHAPVINEDRAKKIAEAYQAMPHTPNDPATKKAYGALTNELMDQYQTMKKSGVKIEAIKPGQPPPYHSSADLFKDLHENNHMYFFPTEQGFGPKGEKLEHPLLATTNEKLDGKPLVANDVLRIVHDYFGHALNEAQFGPKGEEAAWQQHMQMFSPEAQKALTTETRGQNSWVNYGPEAAWNRANPGATKFAEQKAGLMPAWTRETGETAYHYGPEGLTELDPAKQGSGKDAGKFTKEGKPQTQFQSMYGKGATPEPDVAAGRTRYQAYVNPEKHYDFSKDPNGYMKQAQEMLVNGTAPGNPSNQADLARTLAKQAGYEGTQWEMGNGNKIYESFNKKPIVMGGGAAAASLNKDISPINDIKKGVDWYHQNVSEPLQKKFANEVDLTKDKSMQKDPLFKGATEVLTNPTNYTIGVPGDLIQGVEAGADMMKSKPEYAEGGGVDNAPDYIPPPQHTMAAPVEGSEGANAPDYIAPGQWQSDEEKYGTTGQMAKTFLEGAGKGALGPVGPLIEKHLLKVDPQEIRNREEVNPIASGVGEAAGLAGSLYTGYGEAALIGKVGEAGAAMAGFGEADAVAAGIKSLAKAASKVVPEGSIEARALTHETLEHLAEHAPMKFKVGSAAVRQAGEMAAYQGSDEVSKMINKDPEQTAQTAMLNIGLAAALGAGGGAFMEGAVNPLWHATAGPKVEELLSSFKNHIDGHTLVMPPEMAQAEASLGIKVVPELRAVIAGNTKAKEAFNILKEAQNEAVSHQLHSLNENLSDSVAESLGIKVEQAAIHSEAEAGAELLNTFKKEYQTKYGPIEAAFEKRNAEAAVIHIPDEARLDHYGKILEDGMNKVGTDSPIYQHYEHYGNRLLAKETIGGYDMLKTEINGEIEKAARAGDSNSLMALRDIRSSIANFQEQQIESQAQKLEKSGVRGAAKMAEELLQERATTNQMYRGFADMSNELTDHLGVGRFTGAKGLTNKLTDKLSSEQLMNKFSFKGNADFIPFLEKHFPEVLAQVKENELKRFIKPAIFSAKGEQPINVAKLGDLIDKGMAGQKEYINAIIPQQTLDRVTAANKILGAIPSPKSSGTAGWMAKVFKDMPRNAMAGVAMLTGHNTIMGGLIGETIQRLSRDAPDAIRLAHLRFLGADTPINSAGFKSMVDFIHNTYKGENILSKAVKGTLTAGAMVLPTRLMPSEDDRTKLDKQITKLQNNPESMMQAAHGNLGHYMPDHQVAATQTTVGAAQYLQSIKPQPHIIGPLDKPVPPQPAEVARYNRALDIAQQPAIVLQHIKDGTLQSTDIADLHNMYPQIYQKMSEKLTQEMTSRHADAEPIPYKTRLGISLFLGAPVDKSMEPMSIMSAQPKPKQAPPPQQGAKGKGNSTKSLGKSNKSYMTATQDAESDRTTRD